ncbi:isoaspartyl peptidase/L-asparaginase [Candidatus Synechococcus calcipolaris G9]|uniref:Isoaspartyl peptidase/L-asparaginase n=1 Tax=Candidatus Synechococcus calcipolaris G9 TaxID=1497997 RepID=A0ABT6EXE8_9SYNE|nr:isoaspartyl peptidase/L-asparaginase [Candidatus Synechococcus calcipolaris]MDG2989585.1 isoaspartyl peptidase/L-asparaginase [Candidatus Synechococcus calcipolaris G9]
MQPKVIIHGGAGYSLQDKGGLEAVRGSLRGIVQQIYARLLHGDGALSAAAFGCRLLEDEPRFNAGTGSVLQADGQIRMSASLMDGQSQRLSGVINVSRIKNPVDLATWLQTCPDRVLSDAGAAELARELQLPIHNPLTELRLGEWMEERKGNFQRSMAGVVAESGRGTIGVVVLDQQGHLAAGTSTGGKGFERIGRVSDSAMPAGNYASEIAAISCTGIGEDIIDESLASRIVIRVTDGFSLLEAFDKSFQEAAKRQRDFGAIGLDHQGEIAWGKNCDVLLAAYHDGDRIDDTLELPTGLQVGVASQG